MQALWGDGRGGEGPRARAMHARGAHDPPQRGERAGAAQVGGGGRLWLLVENLHTGPAAHEGWPTWQRGTGKLALLPVRHVHPREPMRLAREGANSIWLLR